MHLVSPPNFAVTVVSNCSRVLQSFQEKSKTKAMQNFGINKVHLWSLWKWWILTFQLQQRPDEQGWSTCSFELICCYLFTRAESVPSSCKNKNMLRLWWSQFGPIKYIHHLFLLAFFYSKFYRIQQVVRRGDLKKPPGLQREATSTSQYYKK